MNPREGDLAHRARKRELIRRGMPYGRNDNDGKGDTARGLLGLFFCASLEAQFEHLLGQWGDSVPLGSPDAGNAPDPFSARPPAGERSRFVVPLPNTQPQVMSPPAFVTTRGTAYLFYPSVFALRRLVSEGPWRQFRPDEGGGL